MDRDQPQLKSSESKKTTASYIVYYFDFALRDCNLVCHKTETITLFSNYLIKALKKKEQLAFETSCSFIKRRFLKEQNILKQILFKIKEEELLPRHHTLKILIND